MVHMVDSSITSKVIYCCPIKKHEMLHITYNKNNYKKKDRKQASDWLISNIIYLDYFVRTSLYTIFFLGMLQSVQTVPYFCSHCLCRKGSGKKIQKKYCFCLGKGQKKKQNTYCYWHLNFSSKSMHTTKEIFFDQTRHSTAANNVKKLALKNCMVM